MDEALDMYGYVVLIARSNPELKKLLDKAAKEEWDSARFEREMMNTSWYKTHDERRRAIALQKATDPSTWKQTLANKTTAVASLAAQMGIQINVDYWAERALENSWDDATLRAIIFNNGRNPKLTGGGEAAEVENFVRETYANYGFDLSPEKLRTYQEQILSGRNTTGGIENLVKNQAKKVYSQYADELDAGMTIRDIAEPYMQTMANTLEVPATSLDLRDKYIKKALGFQASDGKPGVKPLWQFERELKDDPRWQYTKQARDETYAVLQQVGQDWGFA